MKKTRVCDLLGVEYPIIQGGMNWIANAELAAAVSNAGALGIISPTAAMRADGNLAENLRDQIRIARDLTNKPFGVNLPLMIPQIRELIQLVIEEGLRIVTTSAGNPATYTRQLKEAGIKVLHLVASARHAKGAEAQGVDAVIAEGYEAGGHNGFDELPTLVLVPQAVDAVKIPVIAAGGVVDARGFVAALALGAEGVQVGTRFVATHECIAHRNFKEAIVKAGDTDTCITGRKFLLTRGLKSELTAKLIEMDNAGASTAEIFSFLGFARSRMGQLEGNLKEGEAYCGAGAGMIKEIMSAKEVVQGMVEGVSSILASLQ
jgi:enoyl-[acyl-carrier protein] reductase II